MNYINPLFKAGSDIQTTFEENEWSFCFIGGLAVVRWGELRMTQDIDLCLSCGFGNEEKYVKELIKLYKPRIPEIMDFALKNRVLLLFASNGVPVDISLSGLPYEDLMINRASKFEYEEDILLKTCSAEDLIVLKSFADRSKDWMDVESIILRQGDKLDSDYIFDQLSPLAELKEAPQILDKLKNKFNL